LPVAPETAAAQSEPAGARVANPNLSGLRLLVLTARDWTHPQGGGSGENLREQSKRWLDWGAEVHIVSGAYARARPSERDGALAITRWGTDTTVFAHAMWHGVRRRIPRPDAVLEIISGVFFLSPLWLPKTPRVVWVHHIHRQQYVEQFGWKGHAAGFVGETVPLRTVYRGTRFLTPSGPISRALAEQGVRADRITTNHNGIDLSGFSPGERAPEPTILFLGRLRRYKRVHLLLDVLEQLPGVFLDIAGDGDQREWLVAEAERRRLDGRVRFHGFVDDPTRHRLLQRAWVNVTASAAEGWGLTVMEAAGCRTPTVALAVGGLSEAIEHERTGLLADDVPGLIRALQRAIESPDLRERLGAEALRQARGFSWDATAKRTAEALLGERDAHACRIRHLGWSAAAATGPRVSSGERG
jgi:glycosyltransferase involved in cell wall biosynthesis